MFWLYTLPILNTLSHTKLAGDFLYKSFAHQCSEHKSKAEYDQSHEILTTNLNSSAETAVPTPACITAAQELHQVLHNKDSYLGNHTMKGILKYEGTCNENITCQINEQIGSSWAI